jgi:hypothetical protein
MMPRLRCLSCDRIITMICAFVGLVLFLSSVMGLRSPRAMLNGTVGLNSSSTIAPLEVFQVESPLRRSYDGAVCEQVIVQHDFAASYGTPFVGNGLASSFPRSLIDECKGFTLHPPVATSQQRSSICPLLRPASIMIDSV